MSVETMSTMPFGKHRGKPLSELPGDYLDWLGSNLGEWRESFRSALTAELTRRRGTSAAANGAADRNLHANQRLSRPRCAMSDLRTGPTAQRPLVHANCITDVVPF